MSTEREKVAALLVAEYFSVVVRAGEEPAAPAPSPTGPTAGARGSNDPEAPL